MIWSTLKFEKHWLENLPYLTEDCIEELGKNNHARGVSAKFSSGVEELEIFGEKGSLTVASQD